MRSASPSLLPVAALLASLSLQGCNPFEDRTNVPPGGPPPAGFATDMVNAHDAIRADPSTVGGAPAPSQPLDPLSWSDTVASRAQAYADGCVYAHDTTALHDLGYGENIAAATPPGSFTAARVVKSLWGGEAPYYDYATNGCNTANPPNTAQTCGHYTQIVWRSTTVVGCGFRTCTTNSPFGPGSWDYWVCDYAPPGNYVGQKPY